MKDFLIYLAKSLVRFPDDVTITEKTLNDGAIEYVLRVNPEDMGKIIGRSGRTAQALRQMASARAALENKRVHVEIAEENE
ncbi:MAG: KH domain-containing protein [Candidatus Omnitrophota bacterium]